MVAQMAEALRFKPESRGFDSRWGNWFFSSAPKSSNRTMAPAFTQPVTEMSI
jgi:hypothetical protein